MKEALEKIRLVEEENQAASLLLANELERYQTQKNAEIQELEQNQKKLRIKILNDLEAVLTEEENQYKQFLLNQMQENNQKDEALYKKNKHTLIQQIINEMRENYGG